MIRFKFEPLADVATKLERVVERGRFAIAAIDAVNAVTTRADVSLRRGETADINLTAAYVKSKTDVRLATAGGKAQAYIVTKGDLTVMGNFGTLAMIAGRGAERRAGPRVGLRNAGTHVAIKRSSPVFEPQWFVLPLRRGNTNGGNGFGVFVRDSRIAPRGKGSRDGVAGKRHVYGPAPYSLFKYQIGVQSDDIHDDLERTAMLLMGREIENAL